MRKPLDRLCEALERRKFALTTVAVNDETSLEMLAAGLRQGRDELFKWGIGPKVCEDDLVGLYIPKSFRSGHSPPCPLAQIRGSVTHLFSVARTAHQEPGFPWNYAVWLKGRISLPSPISFKVLEKKVFTDRRNVSNVPRYIQNLGDHEAPLTPKETHRFWTCALKENSEHAHRIRQRLLPSPHVQGYEYDVGLSYARENVREAQQIAQEFADHGVRVFFNETVMMGLSRVDTAWMENHLRTAFGRETRMNLVLWSQRYREKRWTQFEFEIIKDRANQTRARQLMIVRMDQARPPSLRRATKYLRANWSECGAYGVAREIINLLDDAKSKAN